ncbi:glycosyltransferase family 4 protein [Bacteroidales bacterium OttesenSCG-928-A17]|nr:glycosyltransferase family 4 protein [Bacteroidales bacterium OttesenSCG-928-A17]
MKILLIANGDFFSTYGGGQVYVKNLVDEMIRQQLAVSVFSFINKPSEIPFEKKNYKGVDLYELYTKDLKIIKKLIEEINPNVIHAHAEKALFALISKQVSIPLIITSHHGGITCPAGTLMNTKDEICKVPVSHKNCFACVLRNSKGGKGFYRFFKHIPLSYRLQWGKFIQKLPFIYFLTPWSISSLQIENKMRDWKVIADKVDRVIAPSCIIAENMILNGLAKEKIKVVPHGIPIIVDSSGKQIEKEERLKFFYVGRLGYIKGIHNLLQAFVQLDSLKCELHLIGDISGEYEQKLQKQYKQENLFFHGKINPDKVLGYIRQFDILVHPAIYLEVFGLNISEALSQGKPVIATRCGGAEMQIKDNENGLLIEPNNVDQLRDAMQWMIDHPKERKTMAETADKKVIPVENHVKEIHDLYLNLSKETNEK